MAAPPLSVATISAAIHEIQHALLNGTARSEGQLLAAGALLSQSDYDDVVVERSIDDLCGYPLCSNPLPSERRRQGRYRISLREHRVYDLEETYKYCSEACLISSRAFSGTLNGERSSDLGASKVEEILKLFRRRESEKVVDLGKDGDLGISNLKIQEEEDAGIGEVSLDEWIGPSNAIEGYVPQFDRKQGSKDSKLKQNHQKPKKRVDARKSEMGFTSAIIVGGENAVFDQTKDVSEAIAKKLEEVVLSERKAKTTKTVAKSSKPRVSRKEKDDKIERLNFLTPSGICDHAAAISVISQNNLKQLDCSGNVVVGDQTKENYPNKSEKEFKDGVYLKNKRESKQATQRDAKEKDLPKKKPQLKSSLKSSGAKNVTHSVQWADENKIVAQEESRNVVERNKENLISHDEEIDCALRLASAEACATALTQAVEAVALGITEAEDAVSEAGIIIVPQPEKVKEEDVEEDVDAFEIDNGFVKWPKKTVLLDTDMFEVEDSWHDTPPEGFSLTLSSFATMWMALFEWISCSSLAYIYGQDESSQEDFLVVNGREYPCKITLRDGQSSEIRRTMDGCVCRALPGLVRGFRLPIPISTLEINLGLLLDTMSFVEAIPSFRLRQWQVIVLLFLDALSVTRLPALTPHVTNKDMLLHKVLKAAEVGNEEYETMRDLIIPFGRFPDLSIQRGG